MIKFIYHITKGYRNKLSAIILINIAEVAFSLLFVWFSKIIIDIATGIRTGSLLYYALLLIAIMACQIILRIWEVKLRNMTEVKLSNSIRYTTFSHLIYTRWEELPTMHSGDVLTRLIRDTDDIVKSFTTAIPLVASAIIQIAGAFVLLFMFDPWLAFILGIIMPLLALFGKAYYTRMRKYTHQIKESESRITSLVEESLLNQLVIRTFERQEGNLDRLDTLQDELHENVRKRTKISVFANSISNIAFNGGYITAFLWSAYGLAKKTISFGTVTAYLQLVARIQRPVYDIMRLLPTIIGAKAAAERLEKLMQFKLEDKANKVFLEGDLQLNIKNISFSYEQGMPPTLENFSMVATPGSMTAVVGKTGAGKTTLLRLLLALVKPDKGSISIENSKIMVPVSEATRSNFVYVPQGNSLFSGTIRENLLLGDEKADDMKLHKALSIASALFVFELPHGLDTVLGENGSGLSEGQAQRVAIARSLLRPGKILLLDEATSALDIETEKQFLHHLKQEIGNRTVLFITHHAEVTSQCDNIINI